MTREIKFRAWDKFQKRLIYIQGFIKDGNSIRIWYFKGNDDECILFNESFNISEVTIEQFTGLKDKNGKDIYEGDILDFTKDGNNRFYVEFHDASFYKIWLNDPSMSLLEYIGDSIIIGNVHENPELIAAKDGGVKLD